MSRTDSDDAPLRPIRTGPLHDAFGHLFRRCHLRSQQAFARAFEGTGLTPLQFGILELVMLNPGIGHGELAELMVTAPSVVTTAMKPLRRDGLVIEETAPGDGRRSGYVLSEEGATFFAPERLRLEFAEEMLVGPLDEAERRTLKRLLLRLTESGRL